MRQQVFMRRGAALAVAGVLWCIKAGTILLTGYQPPLTFELGQVLFPVGLIGIYLTLNRPHRLAKTGLGLAIVSLVGAVLGLLYPLVPGAQIATGEAFLFPFSLFVLLGSVGSFVALLLLGMAILRPGNHWHRWRMVPVSVALIPLPLSATGVLHLELPIFLTGLAWLWLAYSLWRVANSPDFSAENQPVAA